MEGEKFMNHEVCIYGVVMLMESLGALERNRMSKRNKPSIMVMSVLST